MPSTTAAIPTSRTPTTDPTSRRENHGRSRQPRAVARRGDHDPRDAVQRRGAACGARRRHHTDRVPLHPQQLRGAVARRHARDRRSGRERRRRSRWTICARCRPSSARSRSSAPETGASRRGRCRPASRGATTRCRPPRGPACPLRHVLEQAQPDAAAVEVLARGADHGAYHFSAILADTDQQDLTFERALSLDVATDPATDVLIAYEMNGEPLRPDHGASVPADRAALVRRRVREVVDASRRPDRAVHGRVPDRPLHLRVARPAARARRADARARTHHRPGAGGGRSRRAPTRCAERRGPAPGRSRTSTSASRATATGTRPQVEEPKGPYQWQNWSYEWDAEGVGRKTLRARATDAAGNVQPDVPPWNRLGYGNNAVEVMYVDVR